MKLSLVIPVGPLRDDWANIDLVLNSALSLDDFELIIIHQDNQHRLCEKRKSYFQGKCISTLLCTEIKGPGTARNIGLEIAKGEWIVFWDSDDFIYIERFLNLISKTDSNHKAIIGNYEMTNHLGQTKRANFIPKEILEIGIDIGLWRFAFRASAIKSIKFPDIMMAEDQIFFSRFDLKEESLFYADDVVYNYRVGHRKSLTKSQSALAQLSISLKILLDEYPGVNRDLISLLIFKQVLSLRFLQLRNLIRIKPFFLLVPRNTLIILRGLMIYSRIMKKSSHLIT